MGHRPGKPGAPAGQPSPLAAGAPGGHRPLLPSPPPGTFPIHGVWDTRGSGGLYWYHFGRAYLWAAGHMAPHHNDAYRAEFITADGTPAVILHRYALDSSGRRYLDPATGRPACVQPVILALAGLPDPHLFTTGPGRHCPQCCSGRWLSLG